MKILIDADGCPVVDIAIDIARQFQIQTIIFCDTAHSITKEGAATRIISKGKDAVDFALINEVQSGDVVITQDYGLAAMALSKRGYAINQNGMVYTDDNMNGLLFARHLAKTVRSQGGHIKGAKKRIRENDDHFKKSLTALVIKALNTL